MTKFTREWNKRKKRVNLRTANLLHKEAEEMFPVGTVFWSYYPYAADGSWSLNYLTGYLTGRFKVVGHKILASRTKLVLRRIDVLGRLNGKPEEHFMEKVCNYITEVNQ